MHCRTRRTPIEAVVEGLKRLGVPVQMHTKSSPRAFLPDTWLDREVLHLTSTAMPGDVLHEAGHFKRVNKKRLHGATPRLSQ